VKTLLSALTAIVLLCAGMAAQTVVVLPPPERAVASLWYRGMPAGTPRQADLDAISAAGFGAVTWPLMQTTNVGELRRMAERASLKVVLRVEPDPLTVESAMKTETYVDVVIPRTVITLMPALVWRAVAHGAKVVSFDAGVTEGTGLVDRRQQAPAWVGPASAVARQLTINATMVDTLTRGPAIRMEPPVEGLDVSLLNAPRSWVLIATNTRAAGTPPTDTYAIMPVGVPPAEWLNLFDGSTIGMTSRPTGARWHVILGPGDARLYVIDKQQK
jgi:hypothetical protein